MIEVWTDGACFPNPGIGGWAWTRCDGVEEYGGSLNTTNNRMEMLAIMCALIALPDDQPATVWSDSEYCVKGINDWMHKWARRGWTKPGGLKNAEQWLDLYRAKQERPLASVRWVRGHAGNEGNERADELASLGRRIPGETVRQQRASPSVIALSDSLMRRLGSGRGANA